FAVFFNFLSFHDEKDEPRLEKIEVARRSCSLYPCDPCHPWLSLICERSVCDRPLAGALRRGERLVGSGLDPELLFGNSQLNFRGAGAARGRTCRALRMDVALADGAKSVGRVTSRADRRDGMASVDSAADPHSAHPPSTMGRPHVARAVRRVL